MHRSVLHLSGDGGHMNEAVNWHFTVFALQHVHSESIGEMLTLTPVNG